MPPREWRVRVDDIIAAAERALGYARGLTFEQFAADARTVDAISYAIVVIGEAAKAVPENIALAAPEILGRHPRDAEQGRPRVLRDRPQGPVADRLRRPAAARRGAESACRATRCRVTEQLGVGPGALPPHLGTSTG